MYVGAVVLFVMYVGDAVLYVMYVGMWYYVMHAGDVVYVRYMVI